MLWIGLFLVAFAAIVLGEQRESRIVSTTQGPVRGYKAAEGYYEFHGIPYATEPTGPNKFKPPLPAPTWYEPFEAVRKLIVCPQSLSDDLVVDSSDNCLIANIYAPDTNETNIPVVVYVHGGAYQFGYGNRLTATNLVKTKKIIAVNFNFRIGAHGLLCLGTKDIPGNAGMKDQVAFLRWVKLNIGNFGGNPNDITLHGWSAGAASVALISISKSARGLFHKLIVDSGSNTASFSVQVDPLANAKRIARNLNFHDINNLEALESFYKNASFDMLWSVDVTNSPNSSTVFAPCIERDLGDEMFLDDAPINILTKGDYPKVPTLIGIAEMEGIYRLSNFMKWKPMMNDRFSDFLPEDLAFPNEFEQQIVAGIVKQFYFGDNPVSEENVIGYINYLSDVMFGYGTAKSVRLQVRGGNNQIYLYTYAFTDESTDSVLNTNIRGATHTDQTRIVMDEINEESFSLSRRKMKSVMRDMWINFITTGRPVPINSVYLVWPPVLFDQSPYMLLNSHLELKSDFLQHRTYFWDEIYKRYYRTPMPPSTF